MHDETGDPNAAAGQGTDLAAQSCSQPKELPSNKAGKLNKINKNTEL